MQQHNVEVIVALLRAGMYKKDLAKLLDMDYKTFATRFYRELPMELQNGLIELIKCVASGRQPNEKDLDNYNYCVSEMRNFSRRTQDMLDERTIAFVEFIERNGNTKQKDIDELSEKFNVSKENSAYF